MQDDPLRDTTHCIPNEMTRYPHDIRCRVHVRARLAKQLTTPSGSDLNPDSLETRKSRRVDSLDILRGQKKVRRPDRDAAHPLLPTRRATRPTAPAASPAVPSAPISFAY